MKKLLLVLLFVPLVSFGQMDYYVSAKGGLNVREAPKLKQKKYQFFHMAHLFQLNQEQLLN